MEFPFSTDELKTVLKTDTGFKNFIASLPQGEGEQIEEIIFNESILTHALNSLPVAYRDQITEIFTDIINIPQEAMRLYHECRYFEARELLLKTIDLYAYPKRTFFVALEKAAEFGAKRLWALCYDLLGDVESVLGNPTKAGQYHHQAFQLAEEVGDLDTVVKALHGLGTYHLGLGDFEKGRAYCQQALDLITGQEDRWQIRKKILTTLSVFFAGVGEFDEALQYAEEAVDLCKQEKDIKTLPVCLNNLACICLEAEDLDPGVKALEHALEVAQKENDLRQEALILNNLAMCYLRRALSEEDLEWASSCIDKAFSNSIQIGSQSLQALSLGNKAFVYQAEGKLNDAKKSLLDAIKIYRTIGSKADEATALANLASHLRDYVGDIEGASQACRKAIHIIEGIRGGLKKESHRVSYADREVDPYELMVDCLLCLDRPDEALEYVERAKSRALLDFLAGKLIDRVAVESDPEAFQQAVILLGEIDELHKNLTAFQRKEEMNDGMEDERTTIHEYDGLSRSLLDKLSQKERAFEQAFSELNRLDPDRASILMVSPIPKEQIEGLVSEDTLFLEMYQTEESLHMFIVTPGGSVSVVSTDVSSDEGMELVQGLIEALRDKTFQDVRSHEFIRQIRRPLALLFDLLIAPLKPLIDRFRRLIISPHLFWHYLPFQALYDGDEKKYLCDRFEVGYCPSASVLRLCQGKERTERERALILSRNTGDLPHVDQEAELLAGAFYPNGRMFKGDEAHLGRVRESATRYDVIHMACHGHFDHEQPFLSGIDIPAEESADRRTYLLDLYGLSLDCNLVTLSACDTGVSRFTSADELIGMSRGLFYAGAAAVMLSLWQVSDESTCHLMENFYWHFAKNRQTKTRALQLAMQAVKAKEEYAHPYYWAPFVIMGDWR